ncbi:MAG TPA: efflux transporter outer membrane subunit [Burkholderiaceae bacterium]|nr:efflux transporter outer membrane subunit [Burkholderiaceae bacterium]
MTFCTCDVRHAVGTPGVRHHVVAAAAWLLALAGCASAPPQAAAPLGLPVPAAWSGRAAATAPADAGADAGALGQWWLRFGDPQLADLVTQALQANTSVKSAQAALRQARAQRDASAAGLKPVVGSSASAQRSVSGGGRAGNSFNAGLDASWEPDVFGANRSALDAGEATARAGAASLGDVQVSVAAEVALNYIALRSAQARLAIARDNLASQEETLQITQWRRQAGLVTSLEAEQARAATEQTRAQVPALQTGIEQARHALAVLCGQPPAALATALAATAPMPQAAGDLALSIPAETLRQRPDVRAAEFQAAAAVARAAEADAARLPRFKLSGSLGLNALTLGSLVNSGAVVGSLLAGVSWPVFDGGAARAQARAQQAALEQAQVAYQAAVLAALKDVEDALAALSGDRDRLVRLQNAAEAAGNAALLARQRYSSGLVDFQTVLETQRTQFSTQEGVVAARADLGTDHVRLYKALGGGWSPEGAEPDERVSNRPAPTRPDVRS